MFVFVLYFGAQFFIVHLSNKILHGVEINSESKIPSQIKLADFLHSNQEDILLIFIIFSLHFSSRFVAR